MKTLYKIFRAIMVTALLLGLALPVVLYVVFTLSPFQNYLRTTAERELTSLLGVNVSIGGVDIRPFSRLTLDDVLLSTSSTDTIAAIERLGAGINLKQLIFDENIVITHVELIGLDGRINRATPDAPLNIQPIIDALSPKDKTKPPTQFDLKINTVVIRRSEVAYDILSAPRPAQRRFDPNHIAVSNLRADITLPRIANDNFSIDIIELATTERSGFTLKDLSGKLHITDKGITFTNPEIDFGQSKVRLSNMAVSYSSFETMAQDIKRQTHSLQLKEGTVIVPADLSPFIPQIADLDFPIEILASAKGNLEDIDIDILQVDAPRQGISLDLKGSVSGLSTKTPDILLQRLDLKCNGAMLANLISRFTTPAPRLKDILTKAADISLEGSGRYFSPTVSFAGTLTSGLGNIDLDAKADLTAPIAIAGSVRTTDFALGQVIDNQKFGLVTADVEVDIKLASPIPVGHFAGKIDRFDFNGYGFSAIAADLSYDGTTIEGTVKSDDPELNLMAEGKVVMDDALPDINLTASAKNVNLSRLGVLQNSAAHRLTFDLTADMAGTSINKAVGKIDFDNISLVNSEGNGFAIKDLDIYTDNLSSPQYLELSTDFINGRIEGEYTLTDIPVHTVELVKSLFPAIIGDGVTADSYHPCNDKYTFDFTVHPTEQFYSIVKMPLNVVGDIAINGSMNDTDDGTMDINVVAPYLLNKGLLLRNTTLNARLNRLEQTSDLYLTTTASNKKDNITLTLDATGVTDRIDATMAWNFNRARRYDGRLNFTTSFLRKDGPNDTRPLLTRVDINPSEFAICDTVWSVYPAVVDICDGTVGIRGAKVGREDQFVKINGDISPDPDDVATVNLENFNLDYIFDILSIDNVVFGGNATGEFTASSVMSGAPRLATKGLKVKNFTYNHALLGDARIRSEWENARKAVHLNADIKQADGRTSYVEGRIMPMVDSLDLHFDADRLNVRMLEPIVSAFASNLSGVVSGKARLFGSFHNVDMTGDIYAEDFRMRVNFTNTYYSATDSVHLYPGNIQFADMTIRDDYGNKGKLNGYLKHDYFHDPVFKFDITDVQNMLVYDVKGNPQDDIWYGRVFGSGSAHIAGEPGKVDIGVNMSTSAKSTFTFVLSDVETASDYTFITFRDRNRIEVAESIETVDTEPEEIRNWGKREEDKEEDNPSVYTMEINVDVTPQAEVILIMDPGAGDRIRAFGEGNMRLTYASDTEDLRIFGDYTLERGNYTFTLQDIIIKDFNILSGSSIRFNGDAYSALLDIRAEYVVNANLSDLDESFLEDKELTRTNVPVHALLLITGDMKQPDIDFDLSFPTLNSDIDRKVRSIISTDDMMSRQIVYLLTLNRFYTPDYMAATKGNEMVSLASSTISSQISNLLGHLSDNWSIAPAIRSDKGDFTDVEVDLALSSSLLNNRLLLNGNLGYRDKALNNNSFIGDFDIEYLLNRSGTIRLKAYNRFNDQNYLLRSALTTQGVGISFRREFDDIKSLLPFLFRKKKTAEPALPSPTLPDTITLYTK